MTPMMPWLGRVTPQLGGMDVAMVRMDVSCHGSGGWMMPRLVVMDVAMAWRYR